MFGIFERALMSCNAVLRASKTLAQASWAEGFLISTQIGKRWAYDKRRVFWSRDGTKSDESVSRAIARQTAPHT
jgi:hypothetical protein